jgi:hypothetical protein
MIIVKTEENQQLDEVAYNMLNEMAVACHPRDKGGKYPMWIRVEYTNGEHNPPHAHLYSSGQKPSSKTLITKFLITRKAPTKPADIEVMNGREKVPFDYAWMIIRWAKEKDEDGLNNWVGLKRDWRGLAKTLQA